ncbi:MAG: nonstructural protein [Arizlama microvirus]|nr:MAG: nonstructural protein [Arizlama microvirus]
MVIKVFSIFDDKAQIFSNPFFMPHTGMATRAFADLVNDGQSNVAKHPSDFKLYQIGEYDDVSGLLTAVPQPVFVNAAVEFVDTK